MCGGCSDTEDQFHTFNSGTKPHDGHDGLVPADHTILDLQVVRAIVSHATVVVVGKPHLHKGRIGGGGEGEREGGGTCGTEGRRQAARCQHLARMDALPCFYEATGYGA